MSSSPVPSSSQNLLQSSKIISQGAEAKVYRGYLHQRHSILSSDAETDEIEEEGDPTPVLLKYRFHKQYRHPSLDVSLTKSRIAGEARALIKCLRSGVNVPAIRMVDSVEGILGLEWIDGNSVRFILPGGAESEEEGSEEEADDGDDEGDGNIILNEYGISQETLMDMIGTEIAKMHLSDVIHGDLTTSNMMLRRETNDLVLIDFGLAYHSTLVEDKAVDLYVLERAFASTHPDSEPMFASVLNAYERRMGKEWSAIKKRLDDVRLRGRKRSMVG